MFFSVVLLFLLLFSFTHSLSWTCEHKDTEWNATYDLCPLTLSKEGQFPYYEVFDNNSIPDVRNFSYIFNIASTLLEYPDKYPTCYNNTIRDSSGLGLPKGFCGDIPNCNSQSLTQINMVAAAYQVDRLKSHNPPYCYRLHNGEAEPIWTMIDETDPTMGIMLTYPDGDYCSAAKTNRELRLRFVCSDRANNLPDKEEVIVEDPTCVYTINIPSVHGCPIECPTIEGSLCGGNGICDYDFTSMKPKCFCFANRFGSDCTLTKDPNVETVTKNNDSAYVGGLVVVVLLLIVILIILGYLFFKLQKIKASPQYAFDKLKSKLIGTNKQEEQQKIKDMKTSINIDSVDDINDPDDDKL